MERPKAFNSVNKCESMIWAMLDSSRDIIAIIDKQGNLQWANRAGEKVLGYKRDELLGKNIIRKLVAKKDYKRAYKDHLDTLKKGQSIIELLLKTKKGEEIPFSITSNLCSSCESVFLIAHDITDRRAAERKLREERDFNQTLIYGSPTFFVAINAKGKTLMMNQTMLKTLGYAEKDVIGKSYMKNFVPKKDWQHLNDIFKKLVKSSKPTQNVNSILTKDGHELLVEWYGQPVFKDSGEFNYFFGVGIDITEQKIAEQSLRASEEKHRTLFQKSNDAIFIHDFSGKILDANQKALDLFRYSKSQFLKMKVKNLHPLSEHRKSRQGLTHIKKSGTVNFESIFISKDGRPFPGEVSANVFTIDNKQFVQGIVRDITERKEAEQALARQYQELKKIDDLKSNILRDVSHELKTPIALITLSTKILSEELTRKHPDPDSLKKYTSIAHRNSQLFKRHVDSIMILSKLQSTTKISKQKINLSAAVSTVVDELAHFAKEKGVKIKNNMGRSQYLRANPLQIQSLIRNLIENALKFSKKGSVQISSRQLKDKIVISVKDTGIGISERYQKHMFHSFSQLDESVEGLGVGLAIVRHVIKLHGGEITVRSRLEKGSRFTVSLPKR
ncbi:PAS domain S-box protein [Nanoarchaeota archaeon]